MWHGAKAMSDPRSDAPEIEWPTLALLAGCYAGWGLALTVFSSIWLPFGIVCAMIMIALHSSLSHEALHGHPFRNSLLNEALVFPCLGLAIPFRRFRDLHLAHHVDSVLTDPYDDPESHYLDPAVWKTLSRPAQWLLQINNTLAGRLVVGPVVSLWAFVADDLRSILSGNADVRHAWLLHIPATAIVVACIIAAPMPFWAYLIAAYGAFSILKIRTYLEHRAHETANGRTVVIEDRGPLAFIFLNNNLHIVHHMHPKVAWYHLPKMWSENRGYYLRRNDGYHYNSYREIFAKHFWRAKDPVAHPLWRKD